MRRILLTLATAAGLALSGPALAAGPGGEITHVDWSFSGPFGRFDQAQLQRGYKVYREVCSSCHGMDLLSFRNMGQPHGPFWDHNYPNPNDNPYVKQIASEFEVPDVDTDTGDVILRPATSADRFPNPYANEYAARGGNGGAFPPDLSVIVKARHGGADYIYSLLTGYKDAPADHEPISAGMHYNTAMPGNLIAMKAPLQPNQVSFDDGTAASIDQMARDVSAFLAWASDPKQTERKQTGFFVMIFLIILAGLTYASYRRVWRGQSH